MRHFDESKHRYDVPGFFAVHVRSKLHDLLEPESLSYGFSIDTSTGSLIIAYKNFLIKEYKAYNGMLPIPGRDDAIPNCVYWCRASKYGNVAWLPYGHERTGNHQAKCEVSRVLLTHQRMRAEKSQAVMRKGQKTHKNTPPPEPALKADCLLTSTY